MLRTARARSAAAFSLVLDAAACGASGELGAPCELGSDCNDGLLCDRHEARGSCQMPHDDTNEPSLPAGGCAAETRAQQYALGLEGDGAWARVTFVDATPAPPLRGDNVWVVDVQDTAGAPLDDLEIVVDPYMPDHAHGTAIRCEVTPEGTPGRYRLEPVNLFMPGLWQVTLTVRSETDEDAIVFSFCVDA